MNQTHSAMKAPGALVLILLVVSPALSQIPATFSYQGYIEQDGIPLENEAATLTFRVYTGLNSPSALWTETQTGIEVSGGVFSVVLGSQESMELLTFDGPRWIGVAVGDAGASEMSPRTPLTSVPYSRAAAEVRGVSNMMPSSGAVGIGTLSPTTFLHVHGIPIGSRGQFTISSPTSQSMYFSFYEGDVFKAYLWYDVTDNDLRLQNFNAGVGGDLSLNPYGGNVGVGTLNPQSPFHVTGTIQSSAGGFKFPDGSIQTSAALAAGDAWSLAGNAGTSATTDFLGTTDAQPFEIRVEGRRALRLEPYSDESSPNVLLGNFANRTQAGVVGGTVAGGGIYDGGNIISGNFGFVGGGVGNIAHSEGVVGGGLENSAGGYAAAVAGGAYNSASGRQAAIPGGDNNFANGETSFAAGHKASALHDGSFVWSDNSLPFERFESTGTYQFLVRAQGGVGIGTNVPSAQLYIQENGSSRTALHAWSDVSGGIPGATFEAHNASTGAGIAANLVTEGSDATLILQQLGAGPFLKAYHSGKKFQIAGNGDLYAAGRIGVATESPSARLHVVGSGLDAGYFAGDVEVTGDVTIGGTIHNPSDGRLKTNVETLSYGLAEVERLRPVRFEWEGEPSRAAHLGLLAQEVEGIIPEIVDVPDSADEHYGLSYIELVPVLIRAIQEQEARIETLETRVASLEEARQ